ncbi:MAG: dTMP kinase [Candidatus Aenigmatarchaeota archaeon]|nr:MAG: dTMP kinase [Candidatus Aenigmarchaeota archaeon]
MKFVAIEGIDGAGGETQSKRLVAYLRKRGFRAKRIVYPDEKRPVGRFIHEWLHSKTRLEPVLLFLLYAGDMLKDAERIRKWLKEGYWIIADRWFCSTLAYQGVQGISLNQALEFARVFRMPKPDINLLLRISPEESIRRKLGENKELDRNETNKELLKRVSKQYDMLARKQVFGKWRVIDGERSKEEVFEQIRKALGLPGP